MAMYDANGMPEEFTSLWYRLRAIKEMTEDQKDSMLAFLAGFTETGWDKAYEQSGASPIVPVDGDPDYNETYLSEWYDGKENDNAS